MRDLLTELVRRTLRPELTLQPRLPSRYDPREGAPEPVLDSDEDDAPRRAPTRVRQRGDADGPFAAASPVAARDCRQPEGTLETSSEPTATSASVVATPNHTAQAPDTHPVGDRSATAGEPPRSVITVRARAAEPPAPPALPQRRQAPSELSLTFVRPALVPAREPAPVAPAATVATPRGTGDAAGERDEAAAPEIRISIGRIDVRAAVGSAAPRRTDRPAGPAESLNDYLDVRARRVRR